MLLIFYLVPISFDLTDPQNDQIFAFWRPRAPPGFVVLGDYLTPVLV